MVLTRASLVFIDAVLSSCREQIVCPNSLCDFTIGTSGIAIVSGR
ncbi:hypothetical protein KOR42_21580 [Thalassoglobus neptunius]|uniref:Uncharacterized protein n=1 Tax=Thalassoglobus neptunius TaxID=1938619 RepID=A0A5C5XA87_9PLAN|nr:hypothetical protein KOR42_21580 [Thalassoglobus neptunius]